MTERDYGPLWCEPALPINPDIRDYFAEAELRVMAADGLGIKQVMLEAENDDLLATSRIARTAYLFAMLKARNS